MFQETQVRPDIYEYVDYRKYLEDFYSYKKETDKTFSYAKFSLRSGLKSPNYFKLVKDNQRNLTNRNVHNFAKGLELKNNNEKSYFESLVFYCQSGTAEEKIHYLKRLKLTLDKCRHKKLNILSNSLFDSYASLIVRELVGMDDFKENYEWMRDRLAFDISKKELKVIISSLIENKLLERDKDGVLQYIEDFFIHAGDIPNEVVSNWHYQLIEKTLETVKKLPFSKRHLRANTGHINIKDFDKVNNEITEAVDNILNKYSQDESECNTLIQIMRQVYIPIVEEEGTNYEKY